MGRITPRNPVLDRGGSVVHGYAGADPPRPHVQGPGGQVRGGRAPRRPAGRLGQRQGGARSIGSDQREDIDTPGPALPTDRTTVRARSRRWNEVAAPSLDLGTCPCWSPGCGRCARCPVRERPGRGGDPRRDRRTGMEGAAPLPQAPYAAHRLVPARSARFEFPTPRSERGRPRPRGRPGGCARPGEPGRSRVNVPTRSGRRSRAGRSRRSRPRRG
jgi:hypothetical protein